MTQIYVVSGVTYNTNPALPKSVTENVAVFDSQDKAVAFINDQAKDRFNSIDRFFYSKFELNCNGNY